MLIAPIELGQLHFSFDIALSCGFAIPHAGLLDVALDANPLRILFCHAQLRTNIAQFGGFEPKM